MLPVEVVDAALRQAFRGEGDGGADRRRILVAFSGGPDSTALLAGLLRLAGELGLEPHAAHLDHGLDAGSRRRAELARELAGRLGAPFVAARHEPAGERAFGREAAARGRRYRFLDALAVRLGARWIVTAHHADDQAETVLLRLLFGSGVAGLAAIAPAVGRVVRPLLGVRRRVLRASLPDAIEPIHDPTNRDLAVPRNRLRAVVLPALEATEPGLVERLGAVAGAARAAVERLDARLARHLGLERGDGTASVDRLALQALPAPLVDFALSLLHRGAGAPYPAPATARAELRRQLARGRRVGCDCGDGRRWTVRRGRLRLSRVENAAGRLTYTFPMPE